VEALSPGQENIVEVGPGTGVLTSLLTELPANRFIAMDVDQESIDYLKLNLPTTEVLLQDFLASDLTALFDGQVAVIGNFPYNISSQILFKILENRVIIPEMVGMFQKEVAHRIASKPGNKKYGILSVLTQAFYNTEYLFTVHEHVFSPSPKVKSAVIKMSRKENFLLPCDEQLFFKTVKTGFNQRRKTLRNSLKSMIQDPDRNHPSLNLRPEQLSVEAFCDLTNYIQKYHHS
jgi:16S rRNA (adenine1518-N6/adenine1519-N6)-dimethyltransferase